MVGVVGVGKYWGGVGQEDDGIVVGVLDYFLERAKGGSHDEGQALQGVEVS